MSSIQQSSQVPPRLAAWRIAQVAVWSLGLVILVALIYWPRVGMHAFWNMLIPAAPVLFVVAPGLWRNVCPLGSSALFLRHVGLSRRMRIPILWQGRLALIGVASLYLILPLRHIVLDRSGQATAIAIASLATLACVAGFLFEWKSGWCSGLCPVHPVEKLYGSAPFMSVSNAHCDRCHQCVSLCIDATPGVTPLSSAGQPSMRVAGAWLAGGFSGFVWGWFQIPDYSGSDGWRHLGLAYGAPLGASALSLALFLGIWRLAPERHEQRVVHAFAATALACYYWYRLPALFGFGAFAGDGLLIDLSDTLPAWSPAVSRAVTTALSVWWLLLRRHGDVGWQIRPPRAAAAAVLQSGG